MAITLTEKAATEVIRAKENGKFGEEVFLRVGVTGGGCSGFTYAMSFDKAYDEAKDTKYAIHGVDVVVDKKSALFLDGTTIDWHESLEHRGFAFNNPNAQRTCGCGSSFQA